MLVVERMPEEMYPKVPQNDQQGRPTDGREADDASFILDTLRCSLYLHACCNNRKHRFI